MLNGSYEIINEQTRQLVNTHFTMASITKSIRNGVQTGALRDYGHGLVFYMEHVLNIKLNPEGIRKVLRDLRHIFMHLQFPKTFIRINIESELREYPFISKLIDKDGKLKLNVNTFFPEILENGEIRLHELKLVEELCYNRFVSAMSFSADSLYSK